MARRLRPPDSRRRRKRPRSAPWTTISLPSRVHRNERALCSSRCDSIPTETRKRSAMKYLEPVQTVNLNRYGHDAIPWSVVVEAMGAGTPEAVLGTTRPDGRPHAAAVGSICVDGLWYVVSGPETRKSRNLVANPACTLFVKLPGTTSC